MNRFALVFISACMLLFAVCHLDNSRSRQVIVSPSAGAARASLPLEAALPDEEPTQPIFASLRPHEAGKPVPGAEPTGATRHSSAAQKQLPSLDTLETVPLEQLLTADLAAHALPLSQANGLTDRFLKDKPLKPMRVSGAPARWYVPEIVLFKADGIHEVAAIRVQENRELEAVRILSTRADVEFAELNTLRERQSSSSSIPNDPLFLNQWHHGTLGSTNAWKVSTGSHTVRVAIVDTPFQMNHPDLAANTVAGWDIIQNRVITNAAGFAHSTLSAGLAAAVMNNQTGTVGMGQFQILPINIEGFVDEMYRAVVWAADNGVRVANISWDGADSYTLNYAGAYLREKVQGLLIMPGLNLNTLVQYPAHPNITVISMTDSSDLTRSSYGPHIDLAAPGWQIFSTTAAHVQNGATVLYASDSGTSYSTSVVAGMAAAIMSINGTLTAAEVESILINTASDKGSIGWDPNYGWGRVDFAAAASLAFSSLPRVSILSAAFQDGAFSVILPHQSGCHYSLWKRLPGTSHSWMRLDSAVQQLQGDMMKLTDTDASEDAALYQVRLDVAEKQP